MKTNNKGFLITGILYSLLLLFLVLIIGMIAILSAKQKKIDYITKDIMTKLNDKYDTNIAKTWEFDYTGNYQIFTVPADGYYEVELWGAQGGGTNGGKGAYTKGIIYLKKGENLYVYVGLQPQQGENSFNGGGNPANEYGYGGGGATDIRLAQDNLLSRIMVAAGGGGHGYGHTSTIAGGGVGGAFYGGNSGITPAEQEKVDAGYTSSPVSTGASQIIGGTPGIWYDSIGGKNGTFGTGANGMVDTTYEICSTGECSSGAGGGGYYGGASGPQYVASAGAFSGSGGSSFVSGLYGCDAIASSSTVDNIIHTGQPNHYSGKVFYNGLMIAGDSTMPTHDGTSTMTGNEGNGYAKINLLSKTPQSYTITNLIVNGSYEDGVEGWTNTTKNTTAGSVGITTEQKYIGNNGIKYDIKSSGQYHNYGTISIETPEKNHVYYAAIMFKSESNYKAEDARFEWYYSDLENARLTFVQKMQTKTTWTKLSGMSVITADTYLSENWGIRNFVVPTYTEDTAAYADAAIIIDLTETFGAGKEPTKEWCDENISYFDGEITIYK